MEFVTMKLNELSKDIVRVLLNDPFGYKYTDQSIDIMIKEFNTPELLVVILILNEMKIDAVKINEFISKLKQS